MSWGELEHAQPELAAFGLARFQHNSVAYLATTRSDGAPRVHPVTPIVGEGHLFVFMEPTSPKGRDLLRDSRYALHCSVSNSSGESGEFYVSGRARFVDDPAVRQLAVDSASYPPADRYILFELMLEHAASIAYVEETTLRQQWRAAQG